LKTNEGVSMVTLGIRVLDRLDTIKRWSIWRRDLLPIF